MTAKELYDTRKEKAEDDDFKNERLAELLAYYDKGFLKWLAAHIGNKTREDEDKCDENNP